MRRYAAKTLLKKKVRGQAEKNAKNLLAEIYSVFVALEISQDLSARKF